MSPIRRVGGAHRSLVHVARIRDIGASEVVDLVRPMHRHNIESPIGGLLVRGMHRTGEFRRFVVGNGRLMHRTDQAGPRE